VKKISAPASRPGTILSHKEIAARTPYSEESFAVPPAREKSLILELSTGESLEGYFQVTSGGNLDIRFWVTEPYGKTVYAARDGAKGRHDFAFKATTEGYYTLHFDNTFSLVTHKQMVLKYRSFSSR
jgi:hypothetical protein